MNPAVGPLAGHTVVTTRDEPGRLDALLAASGADVTHIPLIEIVDPIGGDAGLAAAFCDGPPATWLVVTSRHGVRRARHHLADYDIPKLAAVGSRTADELATITGRPVDLVPDRQTAADLLELFPPPNHDGERVIVAQADRADPLLAEGLSALGYQVSAVTAYQTLYRTPTTGERERALQAEAVAFASGSAAQAWVETIGLATPPVVVAIGPTTAAVATTAGLKVSHIATDHDVDGLVRAITVALTERS